jgi:hypothetical protein
MTSLSAGFGGAGGGGVSTAGGAALAIAGRGAGAGGGGGCGGGVSPPQAASASVAHLRIAENVGRIEVSSGKYAQLFTGPRTSGEDVFGVLGLAQIDRQFSAFAA